MSSSEKSKKSVDKFINIEKERKTNKSKEKVKLNNNNNINFETSKNSDYKNDNLSEKIISLNENNNINIIDKNKSYTENQIKELIDEGVISIEKKETQSENVFDINNIKEMDYEKMFKKIIELNRALKKLQIDKYRLKNEKNIFLNGFNENSEKRNDLGKDLNFLKNYNYSNDDNFSDNRKYLCNTYNKEKLLKQYEEDLNFFNELLLDFNKEN